MKINSVLFKNEVEIQTLNNHTPPFFSDLNLDQVVEWITKNKPDYRLSPFFFTPLQDVDVIVYRQDVFRDLEDQTLRGNIHKFAGQMIIARRYLAVAKERHYENNKMGWHLEAALVYCDAVRGLVQSLSEAECQSDGLQRCLGQFEGYIDSESFKQFDQTTKQLKAELSSIEYNVIIRGIWVRVRKFNAEIDYSRVVKGSGKGVVQAVGAQTEYGKVSQQEVTGASEDTVKLIREQDAWWLLFTLPLLPLLIMHTGHVLLGMLYYLFSVTAFLLVKHGALHQQLLTRTYATPLQKIGIKLRTWTAFRAVGDINLVCFDKTGVLTTRDTGVSRLAFYEGTVEASDGLKDLDDFTSEMVIKACALCHDTWFYERIETGHPLDRAMIHFAQEQGADLNRMLQTYERIYDQPFTSESRYMVCGYEHAEEGQIFLMKGDPQIVRTYCQTYTTLDGETRQIGADFLKYYRNIVEESDRSGHKTIALAYASDQSALESKAFTVLCVLQFSNTLQPGVRDLIQGITDRGIRTLLLTGDSPESAVWAAEACGIGQDDQGYLTGPMLNRMSFNEIRRQMQYCSVYARLSPSQKGLLVRLLQNRDTQVAMVGDGFNDGIALKVSDVGFSFLTGSSAIARKFSEILLNNVQELVKVIESARRCRRAGIWLRVIRVV